MLYGRRFLQPQKITYDEVQKKFHLQKTFKSKYQWFFVTVFTGCGVLFFLPSFLFIKQNYNIFSKLAYAAYPDLIQHLESEVRWLQVFMLLSILILIGAGFFTARLLTKNMLSPLLEMEIHLKKLAQGQWYIPYFSRHPENDFKELAQTYNEFYKSLQQQTESELRILEKLLIDPQNRESVLAWKNLLDAKRTRLGIASLQFSSSQSDATENEFDLKRLAS
ncbi:MAG: HAMP domain-containing protein [Pseudobdellovibrionaceae bacterium]